MTLRKPVAGSDGALSRRQAMFGLAATIATPARALPPTADPAAAKLIAAAMAQVGVTTLYDASYQSLKFPGGDVAPDRGVCTDVIVRAYRTAFGFDLQEKLNADMKAHLDAYPKRWGLRKPDANIDHRRVPNLQTYFARHGAERSRAISSDTWQPGDLITQLVPANLPHIGIVSDRLNDAGQRRLVIHNIGHGAEVEDTLEMFPVTGRYRFLPAG